MKVQHGIYHTLQALGQHVTGAEVWGCFWLYGMSWHVGSRCGISVLELTSSKSIAQGPGIRSFSLSVIAGSPSILRPWLQLIKRVLAGLCKGG